MKTTFECFIFGASLNNVQIEKRVSKCGAVQLRYNVSDKEVKQYRKEFSTADAYIKFLDKVCDERNGYNDTLCLDQLIHTMNHGS